MSSEDDKQNLSSAALAFGMGKPANVVEDQPAMRAVAISNGAPSLHMGPSIDGPRFGKAPPLGIGRPKAMTRRTSSISVKQVWSEENWKVAELEQVPLDFPLERTHREIHGVTACEVASRISSALRLLSVNAEYDCANAKAKCTTNDCVSFRIRLFAGGEGGIPVVVEVQRRNGSPSSFMRVCRSILNAAEGAEVKAETEPARKRMPPFMKGPISAMKCLGGVPLKVNHDAVLKQGLEKANELLASKQLDTNVLGLENLCHLTDPLKTNPEVALRACKSVMMEADCSHIREEISVFLQKDTFVPEQFDNEGTTSLAEKARHMSLVLLSNTLLLTSKDGCLTEAVRSQKWFGDFLVPTLLDEVKSFESNANNSYEAACGLTGLASCSPVARTIILDNDGEKSLREASEFGQFNHELLANESERTLAALGFSG